RLLKGDRRPIVPQAEREELLLALGCVDVVVPFDEPTAATLIETLRPDVYAKGGDYSIDTLPEAPAVQAYGGQIHLLPLSEDRSNLWAITSVIMTLAILLLSVLTLAGIVFAPQIMSVTVNFSQTGDQELAETLTRIVMPSFAFLGIAGVISSVLYSMRHFLA